MLVLVIILIAAGIYIYKYKRNEVENLISKIKYAGEEQDNSAMFLNRRLNDEFENNSFLYNTISNINQNGIGYVGVYPDRMEIDKQVINYRNIGMNELENIGECKALACYIQSNLSNRSKYEVDEISDLYDTEGYNNYAIGYSIVDRTKKYNI